MELKVSKRPEIDNLENPQKIGGVLKIVAVNATPREVERNTQGDVLEVGESSSGVGERVHERLPVAQDLKKNCLGGREKKKHAIL